MNSEPNNTDKIVGAVMAKNDVESKDTDESKNTDVDLFKDRVADIFAGNEAVLSLNSAISEVADAIRYLEAELDRLVVRNVRENDLFLLITGGDEKDIAIRNANLASANRLFATEKGKLLEALNDLLAKKYGLLEKMIDEL